MADLILHPNATPVYSFLSMLQAQPPAEAPHPLKVLDCGAGGPLPPLTLFRQHGYEAWGVDCSAEQLERARQFCVQHQVEVNLRLGDMRALPFEDESFDALYEHFSMCHLSKADTAAALSEMRRVLKPRGLAFVGVISTGTWPQSLFGEERAPGEFYGEEGGQQNVLHSMFTDEEAQRLVQGWEIIVQEKHVRYLREAAGQTSLDEWMELQSEAREGYTPDAWRAAYPQRVAAFQYTHLYFYLRKI